MHPATYKTGPGNPEDQYAVAVVKDKNSSSPTAGSTVIVGHVPKEMSRTCWFFLQHDGLDRYNVKLLGARGAHL